MAASAQRFGALVAATFLLGVVGAVAFATAGESGPSYRIVAAMLDLAKRDDFNSLRISVRTLAPYLQRLDATYGEDLLARFEEATSTRNRDYAVDTTILLSALEARQAVESVRRDDLTGWKDAKLTAAAAYLSYDAVAGEAKARFPTQDQDVTRGFFQLAGALKTTDLTSDTGSVDAVKAALLGHLGRLSKTIAGRRPTRK